MSKNETAAWLEENARHTLEAQHTAESFLHFVDHNAPAGIDRDIALDWWYAPEEYAS